MQKAIQNILGRCLILLCSVQVVLGLLWMGFSFGGASDYLDTAVYVRAAQSLTFDEYTGVLYAILVRFALFVERAVGLPYAGLLYGIQVAAAFAAAFFLFRELGVKGKGKRLFGGLVLLTVPMALQCHLAVLPQSLALSCVLMELAFAKRLLREGGPWKAVLPRKEAQAESHEAVQRGTEGTVCGETDDEGKSLLRNATWANGFWLLSSLLLPAYRFLGAIPVAVAAVVVVVRGLRTLRWTAQDARDDCKLAESGNGENELGENRGRACDCTGMHLRRQICGYVILLAATIGLIWGIRDLTVTEGGLGRVHESVQAAAFRRTALGNLLDTYESWDADIQACIEQEKLYDMEVEAYRIGSELQSAIEAGVGEERAAQWFASFARDVAETRPESLAHGLFWDGVSNLFPSLALRLQLSGRGEISFSGRNVELFRENAAGLSTFYREYSLWAELAGGVILAGMALCAVIARWKRAVNERSERCKKDRRDADGQDEVGRDAASRETDKRGRGVFLLSCALLWGGEALWYTLQGAGVFDYKNVALAGVLLYAGFLLAADQFLSIQELRPIFRRMDQYRI